MLLLALDTTSTFVTAAALVDGAVVGTWNGDRSVSPAAQLPRGLAETLDGAGCRLQDVDAFAVAVGPGSFTGLRVGIATMQGLAVAMGRPLVGVSVLDALAACAAPDAAGDRVVTWVDAWRGEVYAAEYVNGVAIGAPRIGPPQALLAPLDGAWMFIGDGAQAHRAAIVDALRTRARFADPITPPLAATIGLLARRRVLAGERFSPHDIAPLYVRRSYAEAEAGHDG